MGLLTDPSSTKEIGAKIEKFGSKLSILGFLCGVGWLVMQSSAQFNAKTYIDENALQPRMASPKYSSAVKGLAKVMNNRIDNCFTADCKKNILKNAARKLRLKYEEQFWTYSDTSSSNIIIRVRPIASSSAESIIVNVPLESWDKPVRNLAFGTGLALVSMINDQTHWGKDIFFIFSTEGRRGIQCWLEKNFENKNKECEGPELELSAASPQTGVVLMGDVPLFTFVNVEMEGDNGQMTNQDIVNAVMRSGHSESMSLRIMNDSASAEIYRYHDFSKLFFKQLFQTGSGYGSGNHADLIKYGIHSVTLRTVKDPNQSRIYGDEHFGRLIEHLLRAENNLLERLHASIWFYIYSSVNNYSSISLYMPAAGLLFLVPAVAVLKSWNQAPDFDSSHLSRVAISGVLSFFLMEGLIRYTVLPHKRLVAQLSVILIVLLGRVFQTRKKNLSAETSFPLFSYATFAGILCLLCIGQGLNFLFSACILSVPMSKKKIPAIFAIISHPLIIIALCIFLKQEFLYPKSSSSDLIKELEDYTQNVNSNFQLVFNIALPLWTATLFSLMTKTCSKTD